MSVRDAARRMAPKKIPLQQRHLAAAVGACPEGKIASEGVPFPADRSCHKRTLERRMKARKRVRQDGHPLSRSVTAVKTSRAGGRAQPLNWSAVPGRQPFRWCRARHFACGFPHAPRCTPPALDHSATLHEGGGLRTYPGASGAWAQDIAGVKACSIRVAWMTSPGPHHQHRQSDGLVQRVKPVGTGAEPAA